MYRWTPMAGSAVFLAAACVTPPAADGATARGQADAAMNVAETGTGDDELICKKESVSGSLIKQEICMTRAQWSGKARDGADAAADAQRRSLQVCAAGSSCGGN